MGDAVTDTAKVAGTSKVTGTGVANTAPVLAKAGAPAAGKKAPPAPVPMFKDKADALAWANDVMHQDLGLPGTFVHWLAGPMHPTHVPKHMPHKDLATSPFDAWTNAGTEIFLLDEMWKKISDSSTGAEQQVWLWCGLFHEAEHARVFTSSWGGRYPPTFVEGFRHEVATYKATGKKLKPGKHIATAVTEPKAKALFAGIKAAQVDAPAEMQKALAAWMKRSGACKNSGSLSEAAKELCYYEFSKADLPAAVTNASPAPTPAQVLVATYGY